MDTIQKSHYLKQTKYTDPMEYSYLYENISNEIDVICSLVNQQLIHPFKLNIYPDVIPDESQMWDHEPKTVYDVLKKLQEKNNEGFIENRNPNDRVIVTCRGFTLLLVSILRYKQIPARARAGYAPYILNNGINIDHWICEYWDDVKSRWILLDADFMKIDFSKNEFKYTANAYLDALKGSINPLNYGFEGNWGMSYMISYLNIDLLCVLGAEPWYNPKTELTEALNWEPESEFNSAVKNLNKSDIDLLKVAAILLSDPDENFYKLNELLLNNKQLALP